MPDETGEITITASTNGMESAPLEIRVLRPEVENLRATPGVEQVTLSWEIYPKCENSPKVKISWKTETHVHRSRKRGMGTTSETS